MNLAKLTYLLLLNHVDFIHYQERQQHLQNIIMRTSKSITVYTQLQVLWLVMSIQTELNQGRLGYHSNCVLLTSAMLKCLCRPSFHA